MSETITFTLAVWFQLWLHFCVAYQFSTRKGGLFVCFLLRGAKEGGGLANWFLLGLASFCCLVFTGALFALLYSWFCGCDRGGKK